MITEKLKEILNLLESAQEDASKCEKGNASAGRRLRKSSMEAINELKELRKITLERMKK